MDKRAPDNRSIGVFDSGMGGLTAVRRLHALMPKENIIYFGDTSRVPYGTRGRDTIVKYARQDVAFLRQFDLKAIVIACNTVSSVALDLLTEENNIPIIGTVEPACRRAMTMTQNGRVGVIGTAATMRSGAYEKYLHKKDGTLRLYTQACPLFVPLVENGRVHRGDIVIETVAAEYLAPLKEAGVDTLHPRLHALSAARGGHFRLYGSGRDAHRLGRGGRQPRLDPVQPERRPGRHAVLCFGRPGRIRPPCRTVPAGGRRDQRRTRRYFQVLIQEHLTA